MAGGRELGKHQFLGVDLRRGELALKGKPEAPESQASSAVSQVCNVPSLAPPIILK